MTLLAVPRSARHAARRLAIDRDFTTAAVVTLSLGIGAVGAAFAVVHAVLVRPLPYPQSNRLVSLSHTLVVGGTLRVDQTDASLLFYGRHTRAFAHVGGYRRIAAALGPRAGADAERVEAALVTAGLFLALQVAPIRGRVFDDADDRPGAAQVAVVAEGLWKRRFGGDPRLVGARVEIDGRLHEIVGIMPEGFRFPASDTELWLPLRLNPATTDSATFDYQAVARLRDGVSREVAEADLQALLPRLPDEFPGRLTPAAIERTEMRAAVQPLADVIVGDAGRLLWVVFAASALVLAIAIANVTNLFLVRAERRRSAIAVERALGATACAIVLGSFSEGAIVAAMAGAFGTLAAAAGIQALAALGDAIELPRLAEVRVDAAVLLLVGLGAAVAALVAAGMSAGRSAAVSLPAVLGPANRAATAGRGRHRARYALVAAQVALAFILLVGSGLLARSVWRLRSVRPGVEPANTMTMRIALPAADYPQADDTVRFFVRALDRLAGIPGVERAGVVSKVPLDGQGRTDTAVFVADRPVPPGSLPAIHPIAYATPGYFAAAGIPFLAGRPFSFAEPPDVVLEAVVSRALAERYWKGDSPIGKRIRILSTGPWYTVVGEVADVRDTALDRPADALLYCPILPPREDPRWAPRDLAIVVRTAGAPSAVTGAIRDVVRTMDPALPIYRVRTLEEVVARASARRSITLILIGCATSVALLLGAIGLYGVMSYVAALRAREMAIRLALGAQPVAVRRLVAFQGLRAAAIGVIVGLGGAVVLTRFLASLLYEVSPTDPAVLGFAAVLLTFVAAAASWLPTRRTAAIDPALALRAE
jgi:predicted permease